jgi:hypothetical protein
MKNTGLYVVLNNFITEILNFVHITMRSLHKLHLRPSPCSISGTGERISVSCIRGLQSVILESQIFVNIGAV